MSGVLHLAIKIFLVNPGWVYNLKLDNMITKTENKIFTIIFKQLCIIMGI